MATRRPKTITPKTIDLGAVDSEFWTSMSITCPYVAAYQAGRLLHCVDWLLLHNGLRGAWPDTGIDSVFAKIVHFSAVALPSEAHSAVLDAIDRLRNDWSGFLESEAYEVWRESPGNCFEPPGKWNRRSGQGWKEQHSSVISAVLLSNIESPQRGFLNLGYDVDDGVRPLNSEETLRLALPRKATVDDLRVDPIWYEGIRGKCSKLKIGKELPTSVTKPTTSVAKNLVNLVEKLDQRIRLNLEHLWRAHHPVKISDDLPDNITRPSKWSDFYNMHDAMQAADSNCSSADACVAYNRRYPERKKATLKVLRSHKAHLNRKSKRV